MDNFKQYENHSEIMVSIIMPTYNRKETIPRAIDSVLSQTYSNYELIIIDDGSTDGTIRIIKEKYSQHLLSERIRYIRNENKSGVCFVRNQGLSNSKGKWIAYLDSDNEWKSNYLEEMVIALKQNKVSTIYCAEEVRDEIHDRVFIRAKRFNRKKLLNGNYIDLNIFMHSRNCFEELGGFSLDLKRLVDWDLILRYTRDNPPYFLNKVLAVYYQEIGIKHISDQESYEDNLKIVYSHFSDERKKYKLDSFGNKALLEIKRLIKCVLVCFR